MRSPDDYLPDANMMSGGQPPDHPGGPPDHGLSPPGMEGEGRKAKRELSNSKRAAQNRAAQVSLLTCRTRIASLTLRSVHFVNVKRATSRNWNSKYAT